MPVKKRRPKASFDTTQEAPLPPATPEVLPEEEPFDLAAEAAALIPQATQRLFPPDTVTTETKYQDLYQVAAGRVWPKLKP
ncbi:MAG: hypothetical protein KBC69_00120 [Candidatus Magasanikbacteria bacterium]|nr:hypothetical protein [Candidatus Magasanikbacteria bacterium]